MKIGIIGGGIGGLVSACLLAKDGHEVHLFERNAIIGGKMNQIEAEGFRFDTGPSLLTMPFVLDEVFRYCGTTLEDQLSISSLNPLCRYYFADGTTFDNFADNTATLNELERFAPEDKQHYLDFLRHSATLYSITTPAFLRNPLSSWKDLLGLKWSDLLKIDAFSTVSEVIDRRFKSPYLRQFFKRFATYNGSSPYLAPATLNVIPYVEIGLGGFYVKGGLYEIAKALEQLAMKLGAHIHLNSTVTSIIVEKNAATGLVTERDGNILFDCVVSNSDANETYLRLLDDKTLSPKKKAKIDAIEPSCSGFVLLLGTNRTWDALAHHTIFFSEQYEQEFTEIFEVKQAPQDPTIYVANTSKMDAEHAINGGSNLFILVNTPYMHDGIDWDTIKQSYADTIINTLESRGLNNLSESIVYKHIISPKEFYKTYRSNRGSIYGTSSNSRFSAFVRPRNKSPYVKNLYLVGGSAHPGGGIPLVTLSAQMTAELIRKEHCSKPT